MELLWNHFSPTTGFRPTPNTAGPSPIEESRSETQRETCSSPCAYPSTSRPATGHKVYPYLLQDVVIDRPNQVWSSDITYIPMRRGFLYLVAVMDWYSRYVLSWKLSNSMKVEFCLEALDDALTQGTPQIFNTDQGAQFTSRLFTNRLSSKSIEISMDGRGRALDNVSIERLWRSVKYEDIYLKEYDSGADHQKGLTSYFTFYRHERPHQGLGYPDALGSPQQPPRMTPRST